MKESPGEQCGRVSRFFPSQNHSIYAKEYFHRRRPHGHTDGLPGQRQHQHLSLFVGSGESTHHARRTGLLQGTHHGGGGRTHTRKPLQHGDRTTLHRPLCHRALPGDDDPARPGHREMELPTLADLRRHPRPARPGGTPNRRLLCQPQTGDEMVKQWRMENGKWRMKQ